MQARLENGELIFHPDSESEARALRDGYERMTRAGRRIFPMVVDYHVTDLVFTSVDPAEAFPEEAPQNEIPGFGPEPGSRSN
jgi:hypothetical protein